MGYKILWRQVTVGVASTDNVDISSAPATIDGTAYGTVLLAGQDDETQNGVYTFSSAGAALTRNAGFDTAAEIVGGSCHILAGDLYAGTYWECVLTALPTLGTTRITYTQTARGVVAGPNDPVFNDQVESAVPRETDGGWRISKGKSKRKIDASIALVMALFRCVQRNEMAYAGSFTDLNDDEWTEE